MGDPDHPVRATDVPAARGARWPAARGGRWPLVGGARWLLVRGARRLLVRGARRLLVRGADVLDGTGAPARRADILVRHDVIEAVLEPGDASPARPTERTGAAGPPSGVAERVLAAGGLILEAAGRIVAPGFIDVHSHADNAPFLDADDTSKILQGVTTEVVGNCGFSLAPRLPVTAPATEEFSRRLFPPVPWSWGRFGELLAATDAAGYVTNYAPLVGHHALRAAVLGLAGSAPNADQLAAMGRLLDEAVDAGACGLSTGLIYPPGRYARTAELVALARRLPSGRPYVTHLRSEGRQLLASLAEAVHIGERAGCPVQVSHLKASGRPAWGRMPEAIALLDAARARGVPVRHDVYPYTAGSTTLTVALPPWFATGSDADVLRRLVDRRALERLRADLERADPQYTDPQYTDPGWDNHVRDAGWDGVVIASTASHRYEGLSLAQVAAESGGDPFDALVEVLCAEELKVSVILHSMREEDLVVALTHPETMIGSDGLPPGLGGRPHPRMYGTFPRILARYVRDRGDLDLADAVRKMTSLPARTFGLADRGIVAPGMAADLVAFDPRTVADRADYRVSTRPPGGVDWVVCNGELVVRDGVYLGRRAGRRLRSS
ncbi:N-acyl-D-amino-acid deacylase family protein [Planosporangium sp. 12N6]|uniref:N-acyl-D-amino-acid deacylase family protein n=1 Tax=Planosporangium spinosum TaxID=3402278 RepID=UPI003CF81101